MQEVLWCQTDLCKIQANRENGSKMWIELRDFGVIDEKFDIIRRESFELDGVYERDWKNESDALKYFVFENSEWSKRQIDQVSKEYVTSLFLGTSQKSKTKFDTQSRCHVFEGFYLDKGQIKFIKLKPNTTAFPSGTQHWDVFYWLGNNDFVICSGVPVCSAFVRFAIQVFGFFMERAVWKKTKILEANNPKRSSGFVYFIQGSISKNMKIGVSEDVLSRFNQIQGQSSEILVPIGVMNGGYPKESEIHRNFSHLRLHGEWFETSEELEEFINSEAMNWPTNEPAH